MNVRIICFKYLEKETKKHLDKSCFKKVMQQKLNYQEWLMNFKRKDFEHKKNILEV